MVEILDSGVVTVATGNGLTLVDTETGRVVGTADQVKDAMEGRR